MVLDEFALLFHLQDVYWEKEGRKSVDAVVLGAAFGGLFLLRITPLGIQVGEPSGILTITVFINLVFALIAAFKGKIFIAVFGVFIPSLAQIGAIRLAEPDSIWARKLYKRHPKKLAKSKRRYAKYERVWRSRKERAWDILGGKVGR